MNAKRFEKEILDRRREMIKHLRSEAPFLDDVLGVPPADRIVDLDSRVPASSVAASEEERLLLPWEMVAQHYGIPTRLVDWSTSFQIALFFAYGGWSGMDLDDGLTPCVWCLDRTKLEKGALAKARTVNSMATIASYQSGYDAIRVLPRDRYINLRQRAQFGWFTYTHSSLKGVPEYVDANQQYFPKGTLIQLVLRPREQGKVLGTLAEGGITASAIRGDVEGIARDAVNKHIRSFSFLASQVK
jgi:hypothetical protein